ncbi:hypothetical protein ACH4F6_00160 [Streptomyces sp. NPDC017936]|uniref:hypothetical protein n=1 Tax=Streptomyces sp. NPDC017936 TaxID=3365016 RepID=UPI003794810B
MTGLRYWWAKVPGRERGLAVDALGPVIAVAVLAASVHDDAFGTALLDKVATGIASDAALPGRSVAPMSGHVCRPAGKTRCE